MTSHTSSTRQRIVQAALELFVTQGVTNTTTRQIAELAEVNEVTLFRQFGNKHGLVLALIEESNAFENLGESFVQNSGITEDTYQVLREYIDKVLLALERVPELIRSIVGEASQYPIENRRALGRGLSQINQYMGQYLGSAIDPDAFGTQLPPQTIVCLLNVIILGYAITEFTTTTEQSELWDRDKFIDNLVELFLNGAFVKPEAQTTKLAVDVVNTVETVETVTSITKTNSNRGSISIVDLPATKVHEILQQAKKTGLQDFALAYVLFAAGLSVDEIVNLQRSHQIYDNQALILQITTRESTRQVPVNQWIMGKRYGSYNNNPLTKWLKSRKDIETAIFINETGAPISQSEIQQHWEKWTQSILTPDGTPSIIQAQQTWRIEMLMRGMSLENLSILTGCTISQLQPLARRAKEKAAIEEATRLDQK
ncbi:TetR family transcriptional regulator protein [Calothrix sp. NIES-4071]|nr:TetR family transcriptional regulator protein [Calothrix sp. NIES-4071]BAZ63218.1 TetR family transcriptional regulator protein [Calothrix sp. NIES-4105]